MVTGSLDVVRFGSRAQPWQNLKAPALLTSKGHVGVWHETGVRVMRVRIFATLRSLAGRKEVEVDVEAGDTVRNVLNKLTA